MKKILIFPLLFLSIITYADIKGTVTDMKGEPIPGVNIFWLNTQVGTVSDIDGSFNISGHKESNQLVFSNVAFNVDTISVENTTSPLLVKLNEVHELKEVSVVQKNLAVVKPRFSVLQTEKITGAELCKAACCNLSESFETNPSVDVAYSDAATGAKQIKMLGLPGAYVQMLTENIPNLRGLSSMYGLGFIPGPWMEAIQVSKGTGSVINGYEAVTGQINVEYKKPHTSEIVAANVFASNAGRMEANVNAGVKLSKALSTGVLLHASDELTVLDDNKDGYMDLPKIRQLNFINRWYYQDKGYTSQAFVRALSENRLGGTVDGSYKVDIDTKRYEFFLKNGYVFDPETGTSVGLILSGSIHNQKAYYGLKHYDGSQNNFYANLIYQTAFGEHQKLSTGLSFNHDVFDETVRVLNPDLSEFSKMPLLKKEFVPGAFAEYTLNLHDKFVALAGLRADYHNLYGAFITPRLHLKYVPAEFLHLRTTVGKGYRSPNMMAENNFYLASNREIILDNNLKMESAWNYGASVQTFIPLFSRELSITGEWYYTNFENQVIVDTDTDAHKVHFYNLDGKSYSHSVQLEANMEVVKGLTMTVAHRFNDVKATIGGVLREKPLTNRYKSLITASYQTPLKKWQFDFTAQFNGGGRMPDPDPVNPLWEKEFPEYTIMNAQITKYFRTWSVYAGSENLTGFVQKNPIIDVSNPFGNDFDATNIWGPTHGRKFYVGLRWAIDRE
ncbi:TonB-dependent receptor [Paludibacter sp.]